jgi:peptidyl-prolyl cis-trans isomerase D
MLQSIHDRSQGWIVWIIFGLIILTFALWGVQSYLGVNEQPAVAVVDDVKITQNQYQRALQQQRQRFQSMLGANYDPKLFDTPAVRRNIAEQLINDAVLKKFISDSGMRVGDRQIGETIISIPQFQKNGKFSEELFQNYLRSEGMSQDLMFYRLGSDLIHEQVYRGIVSSGLWTEKEAANESRLLGQKRDLGYMVFDHKNYLKDIKVSDKEIEAYYQANTQQFMTDEQVAVEYIELSIHKLADQIDVTDKEVRNYFEQNKAQYVAPEQRRASHILIEVPKGADAETDKKARTKAEDILKQIHGGADFAALARKYSQDPGSAKQGGDLGYFVSGTMTKAFDDKVFSMKKGQISDLVRTEFGYHIIKLTDIKRVEKTFNQVKKEVTREYKKREAEKQYYDLSEKLANIAYESPDSLAPAADETGLKIKTTGLFGRHSATGVLAKAKVLETLFNPDVISARQNEVVEISPEQVIVVRIKDHQPAKVKPLPEVHADISILLKANKAKAEARKQAEAVLAEIRSGKSPNKLAKKAGIKWQTKGLLSRTDTAKVESAVLRTAFTLPKQDKPVSGIATLPAGDVAIVVVNKVVDGDTASIKGDQKTQREKQQNGQLAYNQLIAFLKGEADITRNYDLLK